MTQNFKVDSFGIIEKFWAIIITLLAFSALGTAKPEIVVINFNTALLVGIFTLCFAGVLLLGFKLRKVSPVEVFGFGKGLSKNLWWIIPVGWIALTAMGLAIKFALEAGRDDVSSELVFANAMSKGGLVKMFFAVVILIPVAEEIIFRGLFYGTAKKAMGFGFGAIFSALIFAIAHNDFSSIPHFIGLALFAIWLLERSQSLWPPILLHGLNNLFVFGVMISQHGGFDFVPK